MASTYHALAELLRSKPFIALLALVTHYIIHSTEWDNSFYLILRTWILAFGGIAATTYLACTSAGAIATTLRITATIASLYFSVLVTSILLHRVFLHRLRKVGDLARYHSFMFHLCFSVSFNFLALTDQVPRTASGTILEVLFHLCWRLSDQIPILQVATTIATQVSSGRDSNWSTRGHSLLC